jgi:uncharacterized iron-regulated membrane protein
MTRIWRSSIRKALFQVHLWTGVMIGAYVVVMSLSGSALVFEKQLTDDAPPLPPAAAPVHPFNYGQLLDCATKNHPSDMLASIEVRDGSRRIARIALTSGDRHRMVYVDSFRCEVAADVTMEQRHPVMPVLERLHNELLGGRTGAQVSGIGAGLLTLMSLTGIVLWWPGSKNWGRAIQVNWTAGWRRINYDLHGAVGFWAFVLVLMWGATGTYFLFPDSFQKALGLFPSTVNAKQSTWIPGGRMLGIDLFIARARQIFPHSELCLLYMDVSRPHGQVSVFLSNNPAVPLILLEDIVRFDPGTGEVIRAERSEWWSPGERLALASYSVHFGDFGGDWSKALWALLGLIPAVLTITGYLMWWNRVLSKQWTQLTRKRLQPIEVL